MSAKTKRTAAYAREGYGKQDGHSSSSPLIVCCIRKKNVQETVVPAG